MEKTAKRFSFSASLFFFSLRKLSGEVGVTERSLRTALKRLENDNVLTRSKVGKTLCISIKNFDFNQSSDTETTQNRQQTDIESVTDLPTTKEIKNKEYINKVEIKEKNIKKENFSVPPEIAEAFEELKKRGSVRLSAFGLDFFVGVIQSKYGSICAA